MRFLLILDRRFSMAQAGGTNTTLFDAAKTCCEHFVRRRLQLGDNSDRFCLVSAPPQNGELAFVDAKTARAAVKAATMTGTSLFHDFCAALTMLNANSSADPTSQGWALTSLDSTVVLVWTNGVPDRNAPVTAPDVCRSLLRYDRRIFSFELGIPALAADTVPPLVASELGSSHPWLLDACVRTAGHALRLTSQAALLMHVDSLLASGMCRRGFVCEFTPKIGAVAPGTLDTERMRQFCVFPHGPRELPSAEWPIPFAMPSSSLGGFLEPEPHADGSVVAPVVHFGPLTKYTLIQGFTSDRYALEMSSTLGRLLRSDPVDSCRLAFVSGGDMHQPFGFLRANTARTQCFLYVLCYNFLNLFNLLDAARRPPGQRPMSAPPGPPVVQPSVVASERWRRALADFVKEVPRYYLPSLKAALLIFGVPTSAIAAVPRLEAASALPSSVSLPDPTLSISITPWAPPRLPTTSWGSGNLSKKARVEAGFVHALKLSPSASQLSQELESPHSVPAAVMSDFAAVLSKREVLRDPFAEIAAETYMFTPMAPSPRSPRQTLADGVAMSVDEADADESPTTLGFPVATGAMMQPFQRQRVKSARGTPLPWEEFVRARQKDLALAQD